jgi:hypothetical protein
MDLRYKNTTKYTNKRNLVLPSVFSLEDDSSRAYTMCFSLFRFFTVYLLNIHFKVLHHDSVETTKEMQPCNRIYYSTVN